MDEDWIFSFSFLLISCCLQGKNQHGFAVFFRFLLTSELWISRFLGLQRLRFPHWILFNSPNLKFWLGSRSGYSLRYGFWVLNIEEKLGFLEIIFFHSFLLHLIEFLCITFLGFSDSSRRSSASWAVIRSELQIFILIVWLFSFEHKKD